MTDAYQNRIATAVPRLRYGATDLEGIRRIQQPRTLPLQK